MKKLQLKTVLIKEATEDQKFFDMLYDLRDCLKSFDQAKLQAWAKNNPKTCKFFNDNISKLCNLLSKNTK